MQTKSSLLPTIVTTMLVLFCLSIQGANGSFIPSYDKSLTINSIMKSPKTTTTTSMNMITPAFTMTEIPTFSSATSISSSISSSMTLSAVTLDPTTFLSDLLSGLLNSPAILAVPIVVAVGVASLIAFIIVSYASPEVEED